MTPRTMARPTIVRTRPPPLAGRRGLRPSVRRQVQRRRLTLVGGGDGGGRRGEQHGEAGRQEGELASGEHVGGGDPDEGRRVAKLIGAPAPWLEPTGPPNAGDPIRRACAREGAVEHSSIALRRHAHGPMTQS